MSTDSDDPLQFQPNRKDDDDPSNGLLCFYDMTRECGPACMAYADPPVGDDYKSQQWAQCKLLVAVHQIGKHLTVIARVVSTDQADKKRSQQTPPPAVR